MKRMRLALIAIVLSVMSMMSARVQADWVSLTIASGSANDLAPQVLPWGGTFGTAAGLGALLYVQWDAQAGYARSEVSGRRLWGLFAQRFGSPVAFFADHFVANYCPLAFFDHGRNLTPDKLPAHETAPLEAACDAHLREMVAVLEPEWLVGVGGFAETRAREALAGTGVRIARVLHPSPASPAANRGWAEAAEKQLRAQGIWTG